MFRGIKADHLIHKQSNFFVTVSNDRDKGYWEVDYVNQTANFRHSSNQRLPSSPDIIISDYSDKYNTITDFIKDTIFSYTKEIIKDKKIIFSNRYFCDISNCDKQAKVIQSNKQRYCNIHKGFKVF